MAPNNTDSGESIPFIGRAVDADAGSNSTSAKKKKATDSVVTRAKKKLRSAICVGSDADDSQSPSAKKKNAVVPTGNSVDINSTMTTERVQIRGHLGGSSSCVFDEARAPGVFGSSSNVAVVPLTESPRFLIITGYKYSATDIEIRKAVTIKVRTLFMPKDIWHNEEVRKTLIKNNISGKTTTARNQTINYNLTTVLREFEDQLPSIDFTYPCHGKSSSKGNHDQHDALVNVEIDEVFNRLLLVDNNQHKYIDYHINCQISRTPIGVIIFSKLKKPLKGFKMRLSKVRRVSRKSLPYLAPAASATIAGLGLCLN